MGLDCRQMTDVDYKCPNISACQEHSRKPSMVRFVFYLLNQQMGQLEDIFVDEKTLFLVIAFIRSGLGIFVSQFGSSCRYSTHTLLTLLLGRSHSTNNAIYGASVATVVLYWGLYNQRSLLNQKNPVIPTGFLMGLYSHRLVIEVIHKSLL